MPPLKFDPEATVEEIAGIGRHASFDAVIDDKDDDAFQVVCRRADGTEIPLAKPARAFYFGDRVLYDEEAKRFDLGEKQQILNTDVFIRNERRFDELKRACQRGFVIPFVGAGMSKSAGCPEWKEYLLNLCPEAGFDQTAMRQRLEDQGDYEGVMHDLVTKLGENRFNQDFERDFNPPGSSGFPASGGPASLAAISCTVSMKAFLRFTLLSVAVVFLVLRPNAASAEDLPVLIAAIRNGDAAQAGKLIADAAALHERDARGNSALHWAALANDARLVSRLLAAGADARLTNAAGATPLHYGTGSERIVRELLQAGADPQAKSLNGATPLHTAAARTRAHRSVKLLVDAGADPDAPRALFPGGVNAPMSDPGLGVISPLALAVWFGDPRSAKILLERGAQPGGTKGMTPVAAAAFSGRGDWVRELVRRGGEVNFDDGFVGHALNNLFYAGHRRVIPFVIGQGADLHQVTPLGVKTPPMVWAAYTETADVTVAKALLARGLDVNEPTGAGHTALDWAMKRGETPLVAYLRAQGATNGHPPARPKAVPQNAVPGEAAARNAAVRDSVQRGLGALQRTSDQFLANGFVRQSGCISCHHQSLPAVAFGRALERGFALDEAALARQLHRQHEAWSKSRDAAYEMFEPQPDSPANLGYGLFGLKSLGYEPDELTGAMVWFLAASQLEDGSFPGYDRRPPMEEGQVVGAALAVGALRNYPQPLRTVDVDRTVAKARDWLRKVRPEDSNQQLFRLLGLGWAGAARSELRPLVKELLAAQRPDGGWAPLPTLASDAWATGLTLFVLHEVGGLEATDPRHRRGADFLLRTQFADGSWWVPSRTWPLQPHFDSGFPHGKDQWISAGGTAWAVLALLKEIGPVARPEPLPTAQALMAKHPRPADEPAKPSAAASADAAFARDILPIFQKSCVNCHGGGKPKGDFNLETFAGLLKGGQSGEPAVVLGKPDASPLLRYVSDQLEDLEMPPLAKRSKYPALTPAEIQRLRGWIAAVTP